ncbi:hypothetical protein [Methylobacterium symbioticum]|uniref:Uncharacterized protein n=1 Tax=Methylobacterium symbioticum TaxID=2584084 RepID=A0A509ENC8_9HYPH|nr:hypothetical protein [Methylobacterium symbioticum]VUD74753.1 hypothetical protein MET9862_05386 [Methylobacterium symbioticum]
MKTVLAGAVLAASLAAPFATALPAAAQRIDIGPGGPSLDLRSRAQRERDYHRDAYRRTRDYDRGDSYRRERFDDGPRRGRRDYDY